MNPERPSPSESQRYIARAHASKNRRYAKAIGLILVAMAAGALIGVSGSIIYFKNYYHRIPPKRDAIAQSIITNMQSVLQLNAEEQTRLKGIIDNHMAELDDIRRASSNNTRQLFNRMNDEMEAILGEERYKTWEDHKVKLWGAKHRRHRRYGRNSPNRESGDAVP